MPSTLYSDQITNVRAATLNDKDTVGHVKRQYFSYTVPAATIASGDTLHLCQLPAGARVLGGVWKNTAGGAAATAKIGKYTAAGVVVTDDFFGGITDMTNATAQTFGDTNAKNFGAVSATPIIIAALTAAAAVQAAAVIQGYVDYLL